MLRVVVAEAPLERTENGLVPQGDGWFVLNARDAAWRAADAGRAVCGFEGESPFPQVGVNLQVIGPGEPMAMYHWEADQEDFLVVAGEALLVVEGEERRLRAWDFVHCPPGTRHVIVATGDSPCIIVAIGARERSTGPGWGAYTVDEAAIRHGAGVAHETTDELEAYPKALWRAPAPYRDGLLPEQLV